MACILVAEDDPVLRYALAEWLRFQRHDVLEWPLPMKLRQSLPRSP